MEALNFIKNNKVIIKSNYCFKSKLSHVSFKGIQVILEIMYTITVTASKESHAFNQQ